MQMKLCEGLSNSRPFNILDVIYGVLSSLPFVRSLYEVVFLNGQIDEVLIENLNLVDLVLNRLGK